MVVSGFVGEYMYYGFDEIVYIIMDGCVFVCDVIGDVGW